MQRVPNHEFSLAGKTAMVTGGAAGIGHAICEAYLAKGANVVLLDVHPDVGKIAEQLSTSNAVGIKVDVTSRQSIQQATDEVKSRFGGIDILVNCAGIVALDDALELSDQDWDNTMNINLKGVYLMSQIVGREMVAKGYGRIVNIASQAGMVAIDKHLAYCASKAGVISLTQVLALEWSPKGVTVNAISPTVVLTELGKKAWSGDVAEEMKLKIPTRRFAEPHEIASAAVYLASDEAAMISGANLVIDGGYTIQ
ncbi:D-threitol dehydrogenase [Vibrio nigripulchritudo]|uniref:SDR family oxidoreductase n=1 Tax=Vibrio nigripulchritudo TaxID=28173 RepID=UPI00190AD9BF|nr:D-threitol dehydrogenase [Vibrio nigripulchritudo]BCL70949.1 D-threitol dehydrogenase [Vibrio nigripulchritudo]BDU32305.1 D-threitol dehydrogenase [Vibrio nigripulchritudo]